MTAPIRPPNSHQAGCGEVRIIQPSRSGAPEVANPEHLHCNEERRVAGLDLGALAVKEGGPQRVASLWKLAARGFPPRLPVVDALCPLPGHPVPKAPQ